MPSIIPINLMKTTVDNIKNIPAKKTEQVILSLYTDKIQPVSRKAFGQLIVYRGIDIVYSVTVSCAYAFRETDCTSWSFFCQTSSFYDLYSCKTSKVFSRLSSLWSRPQTLQPSYRLIKYDSNIIQIRVLVFICYTSTKYHVFDY